MTREGEFKVLVRQRTEITGESYTQALRHILDAARTAVPSAPPEASRPARPQVRPPVPRPWQRPETELPAIVPIGTLHFDRFEASTAAITGISAYSNGFEISMTGLIRPGAPGLDEDPPGPGSPLRKPESFCQRFPKTDPVGFREF